MLAAIRRASSIVSTCRCRVYPAARKLTINLGAGVLITSCGLQFEFSEQTVGATQNVDARVIPKSIQTRLGDLAKDNSPLVLADTFPREKESDDNLPVLDLCTPQEDSTVKSLDPFIQGLVNRLPEPDSIWSLNDRVKWLRTAANIFGLIYKCHDGEDKDVKFVLAKNDYRAYVTATTQE